MIVGGEKGSFSLRRQTRNSLSKSELFQFLRNFYRKVFPSILGSLKFKGKHVHGFGFFKRTIGLNGSRGGETECHYQKIFVQTD